MGESPVTLTVTLARRVRAWGRFQVLAVKAPALRRSSRFAISSGADIQVVPSARWQAGTGINIRRDFTAHVHGSLSIGDDVFFNRGCHIVAEREVTIGARCLFGERVSIHDSNYPLAPEARRRGPRTSAPINIGDDVWIGANAVILAGTTVGSGAVIAAGAVVTDDVAPRTLVAGVPARRIRSV